MQDLHSVTDYSSALEHEQYCSPAYGNYLKKYLVPSPGDWPSWYFVKKILVNAPGDSPLLSIIPEQGPFHVTLNAHETAVTVHRFFFAELHKHLFNSALPEKPKPDRVAVLIAAAFLGWLMLRSKVLRVFQLCKDIEYTCLLYLFEEVLPLLFFHYPVTFRSSKLDNYLSIMRRFAVLFICWKRRHYNKSTLSLLSDTLHQKININNYFCMKKETLAAITDKKVEIWHSLLRDSIQRHYTAEQIRLHAQLLSLNKIQHEFRQNFVPDYHRGTGERDQTLLAGRSAEFIIQKLKLVAKNLHIPKQVSKVKMPGSSDHLYTRKCIILYFWTP